MKAKQIVPIILSIVLVLSVGSGILLQLRGDQSGGVTSTNEIKYESVIDTSRSRIKSIEAGARNGTVKTIGSVCNEFSKVLVSAYVDVAVSGEAPFPVTDVNGSDVTFFMEFPCQISLTCYDPADTVAVYVCWNSETSEETYRVLVGYGELVVIEEPIPEYGAEECWLELASTSTVYVSSLTVEMVPQAYPSGVTKVVASSKNLVDVSGATDWNGTSVSSSSGSFTAPAGLKYGVDIPISLPSGTYITSFLSAVNEYGEFIEKFRLLYADGTQSLSIWSGDTFTVSKNVTKIRFFTSSGSVPLQGDVVVSDLQIESGTTASEYTPYFASKTVVEIPAAVQSLPGYGVGSGMLYNYIDLVNGTYVQTCSLVGADVVALDEPRVTDISYYLPPGSGNVDLYGVGSLIFENPYGEDPPTEISYRRIIK